MYNHETLLRIKTRWDILDFILLQLGLQGDKICKKQYIPENEFYTIHIDLICKHDITRFKRTITQLTKPFYPYIIFTYYILFHGKNLKTAYELYQMILERYYRNPREFNEDELIAFEMLREVIETFKVLSEQKKKNLPSHMAVLSSKLKNIKCSEYSWSYLFRNLLLSWIDVHDEEILENLKKAKTEEIDILDKDIIEHYNIIDLGWESPIHIFFYHLSHKLSEKLEKIIQLKKQKESYKNRLIKFKKILKIEKIIEKVEKYTKIINSILYTIVTIATSFSIISLIYYRFAIENFIVTIIGVILLIFLVLNTYYKLRIKKIDEKIKSLRFGYLEKIIWSSK